MRRRIVARMLPADIPQTDHLLELVEMRGIPSITISLPSSPVPADHERIRLQLRDLIDDADRQAKETSVGRPEREAAIARLRSVLDDDDFWTHQSRSLVLLASAERLETFRLANRLTARATVSDRFDTGPLLRAVTFPRRAFVVQISRGGARLTEFGADHGLAERDLSLPSDHGLILEEADNGGHADFPRPQGSTGDRLERERFCRVVQDEVVRIVPRDVPVILCVSTDLEPAYRAVNTHPALLEPAIDAHPDSLGDDDLEERARSILDRHEEDVLAAWRERFGSLEAQGLATTSLDDVAVAADQQGRAGVGDDQHGFQPAQGAVAAPVLGQLYRGAGQVALELGQRAFEALEQGEGVGGAAGEPGQDLVVVETPYLAGVAFHHRLAEGDLAVAAQGDLAVLADAENGGGVQVAVHSQPRVMLRPVHRKYQIYQQPGR